MGQPTAWRAEEKGIDVLMALDIAIRARDDHYDVAVVVSIVLLSPACSVLSVPRDSQSCETLKSARNWNSSTTGTAPKRP